MAESNEQTPVKPAEPIAVDVDAAVDESAGVVSTEPTPAPIIPPSGDAPATTVEDLFRAGEEERAKQEAAQQTGASTSEAPDLPAAEAPAKEAAPSAEEQPVPQAKPAESPAESPAAPAAEPKSSVEDEDVFGEETEDDDDEPFDDIPTDLKVNSILLDNIDVALQDIRATYKTAKEFDAAQNDPTSKLSKYMTAALHGWPTGKRNFLIPVIKGIEGNLVKQAEAGVQPIVDGRPTITHKRGVNLSGKEATLVLQSCLGGLHRVCLLNSGFWVLLRAPGMDELNELFNTIDAEGKELGRSLGAHYALISDMYIKKRFLDMLIKKRIIQDSNFKDIFEKDAFNRVLSFNDYDALMHGILSMCTRQGLRLQLYCPKCHEESTATNMDISACKFINRNLLTDSMIDHWNRKRDAKGQRIIHTRDDLQKYQEMLPVQTETITQVVDMGLNKTKIELVLSVPSFARFFRVGDKLIAAINQTINNIAKGNEAKEELVRDSLEIHGYQLIAPWVKTLKVFENETDTEPMMITEDTDVILDYLDSIVQQDLTLDTIKVLNDFVQKTRITYIGTFSLDCPYCHAKPDTDGMNFYPIDVHTVFFGQCFRLFQKGSK